MEKTEMKDTVRLPNGIMRLSDEGVKKFLEKYNIKEEPYYKECKDKNGNNRNEKKIFEACLKEKLPLLIKGPTGCGKTRFVEYMSHELEIPLVTVSCHEDLTASGLLGMLLPINEDVHWKDGPLSLTARGGGICYLDEIVEARKDTTVAIHSLTDHRRQLTLEKTHELIKAPDDFMLVITYNPGYQSFVKNLKPSTKQRFVAMEFDYPCKEDEIEIVKKEGNIDRQIAARLAEIAEMIRDSKNEIGEIEEAASTRSLVYAARLISAGVPPREACKLAIINVITDNMEAQQGINDIVEGKFDK